MPDSDSDVLTLFLVERSGVRGVLVHLDETWQAIQARAPYPPAVAACLGETCAAAALFTGHAKLDGRLSVQLRGTGALKTLFAECTAGGTLRGIAHYSEPLPQPLTPRAFGAGRCVQTLLAKAQVLIHARAALSFEIHVARSFAEYAWGWLENAQAEYAQRADER